jgi:DNA-3-methyladenine glycosylase I
LGNDSQKEDSFRKAYSNFSIEKIAAYTEKDRERLLADPGIIRNKLKVNAAIENAKTILELKKEFGSFEKWLEHHHPKTKEEWVKLFKKTFRFTGGEIVGEFLMSIGFLKGAHSDDCKINEKDFCCRSEVERINHKKSQKKVVKNSAEIF